ncbi:MAG: hypothetical protein LBM28_04270 [Oscillospiraceae bacterium]|nr:hypothetical protein [Oscillospiraceae bacterium]
MFRRLGYTLQRFMRGRYGSDKLNLVLLVTAVVISLVNSVLTWAWAAQDPARVELSEIIAMLLSVLTYALLVYAVFRMMSRNIYKRGLENKKFLNLWMRLKDRNNRYFSCPACKQTVRVPKRRGKICIRCPKCGEKFIRKT